MKLLMSLRTEALFFFICSCSPQLLQASSALKIPAERGPHSTVLHAVEGLALVLLCSCQLSTRRLAIAILREIRSLFVTIKQSEVRTDRRSWWLVSPILILL